MSSNANVHHQQLPSFQELVKNFQHDDPFGPQSNSTLGALSFPPILLPPSQHSDLNNSNYTTAPKVEKNQKLPEYTNDISHEDLLRYIHVYEEKARKIRRFSKTFMKKYADRNQEELLQFLQTIASSELDIQINLHESIIEILQLFRTLVLKSYFRKMPSSKKIGNAASGNVAAESYISPHSDKASSAKLPNSKDGKLLKAKPLKSSKHGCLNIELSQKFAIACQHCGSKETPEWRRGPRGSRTLCNACGLFYSKLIKKHGTLRANEVMCNRKQIGTVNDRRV